MARIRIPPPDVRPIGPDGLWTKDWYDVLKGLERVGLLDLADVSTTAPADTNTVRWSAAQKKFNFGA